MGVQKRNALGSHAIQMRRRYSGIRIQMMHISVAHIVGENDHNIGFFPGIESARSPCRKYRNDAKTNSAIHHNTFRPGDVNFNFNLNFNPPGRVVFGQR